jgi:bifunctional non-homologous end joining protein LigD
VSLRDYARKRRFGDTPEPDAGAAEPVLSHRPIFVVQLHNARARHFDFRLEADGVLKSWAVPKGPSLRAGEKRLAVQVEDHPLGYARFEGEIPEGNYGAGHVLVFDHGVWSCEGDPLAAIADGKLDFTREGEKLQGGWKLVRTGRSRGRSGGKPQWLLIKRNDAHACDQDADDLVEVEPGPASSAEAGRIWRSGRAEASSPPKRKPPATPSKASAPTHAARRIEAAWRRRAAAVPGARPAPFAAGFKPELATLGDRAPSGDDWLHEIKWDGYRMLADMVDGQVRLRSRNGLDWTADFPGIVSALEALPVAEVHLDGELVALDDAGNSDFALLQRILKGVATGGLRYALFDMPGVAGIDLSKSPLLQRKDLLHDLLEGAGNALLYSAHVVGHGPEVFAASGRQGLEGIVSKRIDAPYTQRRSARWLKVKHESTDEFAIVGYSAPKNSRVGFGALLMASRDEAGELHYAGRVGTGFDTDTLHALWKAMQPLRRKSPAVELPAHLPHDKRDRGNISWLKPALVAEIAYRGFGKEGLLRQASFRRLRTDKDLMEIAMTTAKAGISGAPPTRGKGASTPSVGGRAPKTPGAVAISSRDRIVFPDSGITKGEVADYYAAVADWILPGLADRPLSLLRCPEGVAGQCFFQKHHAQSLGNDVRAISLRQKGGAEDYLYVSDAAGLLELVQMNAIEFHPWGARVDQPEQPDMLVFDLDPDPGVAWKEVVAGARDVRDRLQEAGLASFVRLSGGKGLHVVVPIARGPGWDQVRDFSAAFAEAMTAHAPLRYVATMSKARRKDRIFIDWLRNGRGATSVCNWSLRAREGAPVAMPIRWEELGRMPRPDAYDLRKALRRAAMLKDDPWAGYWTCGQSLPG